MPQFHHPPPSVAIALELVLPSTLLSVTEATSGAGQLAGQASCHPRRDRSLRLLMLPWTTTAAANLTSASYSSLRRFDGTAAIAMLLRLQLLMQVLIPC